MSCENPQVIIVGGGLSGLACGRSLARAGISFQLVEAADRVGGRVRTDEVEGFLLDRGFQVMLPSYPEARRILDYDELDLRRFYRGAEVITSKHTWRIADPLHHPVDCFRTLTEDLMTWRDRWFSLLLRKESFGVKAVGRLGREMETEDFLREFGFSDKFINKFFRPFFGGIFLEKDLRTSAAMFRFLFAMFDRAGAALPAHGMQAIPDQLAAKLPQGSVRCGHSVAAVAPGAVTLSTGETLRARHIVLATSQIAAEKLLPEVLRSTGKLRTRSVTCLYFAAHQKPSDLPILFLDGHGCGPVNNACVLSNVSPHYAPAGQHLISASVIGTPAGEDLEWEVRRQLTQWFGVQVGDWRHLRTYRIMDAQPEDTQLRLVGVERSTELVPGLLRAGDYCEDVSINGALISGRKAAEWIIQDLSG